MKNMGDQTVFCFPGWKSIHQINEEYKESLEKKETEKYKDSMISVALLKLRIMIYFIYLFEKN